MTNRFKNTTSRVLKLGGATSVKPGEFMLAADARHLVKRPLFQAYLKDRSIVPVKEGKQAMTTEAKASQTRDQKATLTASENKKDSDGGKSS